MFHLKVAKIICFIQWYPSPWDIIENVSLICKAYLLKFRSSKDYYGDIECNDCVSAFTSFISRLWLFLQFICAGGEDVPCKLMRRQSVLGEHRGTKTPGLYRYTTEPEAWLSWCGKFYEALDLVTEKLKKPFNQDGMKTASLREEVIIKAVNKEQTWIQITFTLPCTLTEPNRRPSWKWLVMSLLRLHVKDKFDQTPSTNKGYFWRSWKPHKLCLCLPSQLLNRREHFPPCTV